MRKRSWIGSWPVYRQLTGTDPRALGAAAKSDRPQVARTRAADAVVKSVCPYCAVGCGQNVYVKGAKVVQIEGDPDSPVSRGRLCPKGSASLQLTTGDSRQYQVRYRRPFGAVLRLGEVLTAGGLAGALLGRRSRVISAVSGASLLAASALTRFGIFMAGQASARDPAYTVGPQRERQDAAHRARVGVAGTKAPGAV